MRAPMDWVMPTNLAASCWPRVGTSHDLRLTDTGWVFQHTAMATPIPISDVISRAGGAAKLAGALGCDRTTPYSWRRVPAERAVEVARLIGCTPAELRPDVFKSEAA